MQTGLGLTLQFRMPLSFWSSCHYLPNTISTVVYTHASHAQFWLGVSCCVCCMYSHVNTYMCRCVWKIRDQCQMCVFLSCSSPYFHLQSLTTMTILAGSGTKMGALQIFICSSGKTQSLRVVYLCSLSLLYCWI